jgi:hypothetical protein
VFIIPSGISVFREEKDLTEMEKLLEKVAFAEGPADDEILAYLQGGWTDIPALQQKLSGTTRLYEATLARAELDEAYAKLRANFTINADELEAAFSSVCEAKAELLPPPNI